MKEARSEVNTEGNVKGVWLDGGCTMSRVLRGDYPGNIWQIVGIKSLAVL